VIRWRIPFHKDDVYILVYSCPFSRLMSLTMGLKRHLKILTAMGWNQYLLVLHAVSIDPWRKHVRRRLYIVAVSSSQKNGLYSVALGLLDRHSMGPTGCCIL